MIVQDFHAQTAKFLGVLGQNMPAINRNSMQAVIDHPEIAKSLLKGFAKLRSFMAVATVDPFKGNWKEFRGTLDGWRLEFITDAANDVLKCAEWVQQDGTTVDLVITDIQGLGFIEPQGPKTVYARAEMLGLKLLPASAWPSAFLKLDMDVYFAMKPVMCSDGQQRTLMIENRTLGTCPANSDEKFTEDDIIVFCVPAK